MPLGDKLLLHKRSLREVGNERLKNICPIEYSRHRVQCFSAALVVSLYFFTCGNSTPVARHERPNMSRRELKGLFSPGRRST